MFTEEMRDRAAILVAGYREKGLTLVTAESCTGGLVAGLITEIPGSSDVFERGFVTYSNAAKVECLGVGQSLLDSFGAVSREVAEAMAAGALAHSCADAAVSITGIAGPGGGSAEKPVGLVHFAYGRKTGEIIAVEKLFDVIGRDSVRSASVALALDLLFEAAR